MDMPLAALVVVLVLVLLIGIWLGSSWGALRAQFRALFAGPRVGQVEAPDSRMPIPHGAGKHLHGDTGSAGHSPKRHDSLPHQARGR